MRCDASKEPGQRRGDIQATEVSCDASKEELLVGGYSACRLLLVATPHCFDSILFSFFFLRNDSILLLIGIGIEMISRNLWGCN